MMVHVAFTRGRGFFAWLVRFWTWGPYSHCELVFGDGQWFGCSALPPFDVGFHQSNYTRGLEWDLQLVKLDDQEFRGLREFCEGQVGAEYDWAGVVLSQVLPVRQHSRRRWFCSEIVAAALQAGGRLLDVNPHRLSPNKLARLLGVRPA